MTVPAVRVLGIVGSLRSASDNLRLFRAPVELAPPELSIGLSSLADIPLYNADVEALGDPPAVAALRAAAQASAMRIASPEFNYGVPGVLKNAIDWISRPPERSPLQRKPRERLTALMAALAAWTRRF